MPCLPLPDAKVATLISVMLILTYISELVSVVWRSAVNEPLVFDYSKVATRIPGCLQLFINVIIFLAAFLLELFKNIPVYKWYIVAPYVLQIAVGVGLVVEGADAGSSPWSTIQIFIDAFLYYNMIVLWCKLGNDHFATIFLSALCHLVFMVLVIYRGVKLTHLECETGPLPSNTTADFTVTVASTVVEEILLFEILHIILHKVVDGVRDIEQHAGKSAATGHPTVTVAPAAITGADAVDRAVHDRRIMKSSVLSQSSFKAKTARSGNANASDNASASAADQAAGSTQEMQNAGVNLGNANVAPGGGW